MIYILYIKDNLKPSYVIYYLQFLNNKSLNLISGSGISKMLIIASLDRDYISRSIETDLTRALLYLH